MFSPARADQISMIEDSGVAIMIGDQPTCSGTIVATLGTTEVIVTAAHCFRDEDNPEPTSVKFFNGDWGRIVHHDEAEDTDVALVLVQSMRRHTPVMIDRGSLRRLDPVVIFGLPGGQMWTMSRGYALQGSKYPVAIDYPPQEEAFPWSDAWEIDCSDCTSGSSGGGVFSKRGLIGIVVGHNPDIPNHEYIEPIQDAIDLVRLVESAAP